MFVLLILLLGAVAQNRQVAAFIGGNALSAKEDAARLNFMIRDIGLQVAVMQASRNTFDLNAANVQLQQQLIKLDEVLYRLTQYNLDRQPIAELRNATVEVKNNASQTLALFQRKLERSKMMDNALSTLIILKQELELLQADSETQKQWIRLANEAVYLMIGSAANLHDTKIEALEQQFNLILGDLNTSAIQESDLLLYREHINQLGTGNSGVFELLRQVIALEFSAKSAQSINAAISERFIQLGQKLFAQINLVTQSGVKDSTNIILALMLLAVTVLIICGWRMLQGQQYLNQNILGGLVAALQAVKSNSQSDLSKCWQETETGRTYNDELTNLLAECKRLFNRMQRSNQELQDLSSIGRDFSTVVSIEQLFERMRDRAKQFSAADVLLVGLWQADTSDYEFPVSIVIDQERNEQLNQKNKKSHVIEKIKLLVNDLGKRENNIEILSRKSLKPYVNNLGTQDWHKVGSMLFLTLHKNNGAFLGCICLACHEENGFSPGQIKLMETLARYVAIAIENAATQTILSQVQRKLHLMEKMTGLKALSREEADNMLHSASWQANKLQLFTLSLTELFKDLSKSLQEEKLEGLGEIMDELETINKGVQELGSRLLQIRSLAENVDEVASEIDLPVLITNNISLLQQEFSSIHFQSEDLDEARIQAKEANFSMTIQDVMLNSCLAIKQRLEKNRDFTPLIKVATQLANNQLRIKISDNGQGLVEAATSKILEPDFNPVKYVAGERISLAVANSTIMDLSGKLTLSSDDINSNITVINLPLNKLTVE